MGRNNKARRAAKSKKRATRGTPRTRGEGRFGAGSGGAPFAPDPKFLIAAAWFELENAARRDETDAVRELSHGLATHPRPLVDQHVELVLQDTVAALWQAGWQPAELRRQVRRKCSAVATRLVELAMLIEMEEHTGPTDERWRGQLAEFSMRNTSTKGSWLSTWRSREAIGEPRGYELAASVMAVASSLPALDVLLPPPGTRADQQVMGVPSSTSGDPMLSRIRKLLSKAESTEFEAEAMALTAKAQALMTRHAIDLAAVTQADSGDVPRMVRLPVDAPYADAKSLLLAVIAAANRGRAVYLESPEMSTIPGHAGDLAVIELMFTSLLVQAQNSLAAAGRTGGFGARARTQSFRSSFFIAYARRIEERLQATNDEVFAHVEDGASSLPVLRAREDAVQELMDERFGDSLHTGQVRGGYDMAGSAYGRQAADDAELDSGELLW